MTERGKITTIYLIVAVISIAVLATSFWIRHEREQAFGEHTLIQGAGKEDPPVLRTLEADLEAVNQAGETVRLSQLDNKVWVVNQFFANCPVCLKQNSVDMIKLYREFQDHPDFHMVSITVDPERDTVENLHNYARAVGAADNWWFLTGEKREIYRFLTEEMKYTQIKENPGAVGAKRYAHDFGVQVYGRERRLVRTRDLVSAMALGEEAHQRSFEELRSRIAERLETPLEEVANGE